MMWLSDYSTPSLEGYHKYEALIGPGQTTGSTGGFDLLEKYIEITSRNLQDLLQMKIITASEFGYCYHVYVMVYARYTGKGKRHDEEDQ